MAAYIREIQPVKVCAKGNRRPRFLIQLYDDCEVLKIIQTYGLSNSLCSLSGGFESSMFTNDAKYVPINGFTTEMLKELHKVSHIYTYSSLSSFKQREALYERFSEVPDDLEIARNFLDSIGLLYDEGFLYGMYRTRRDDHAIIPKEVVKFLFSLPGKGDSWENIKHILYPTEINLKDFYDILINK